VAEGWEVVQARTKDEEACKGGEVVLMPLLERPDLFVKKSMVEDPWKNLVPVIMVSKETMETSNTVVCSIEGNRSDADTPQSQQYGSNSLKKIKPSQIANTFQSGPSLAESLALSLAEAMGE